jgi:hypothetical protein
MNEIQLIEGRIEKILRQKIFSAESVCKDFSIKTVKNFKIENKISGVT